MERVRISEDERKDFYLYVDEFQNFVTDSFASILSEARKYRLNLTVAHQYTAQLVSDKSSAVRDAVFGNVGTMIVFRCGAEDADFLEKEFDPEFTPQDIVSLPNYKIYLKLMIDGITSRPFSAKTLPPMAKQNQEVVDGVIKSSRELYCRKREDVEREINNWSGMSVADENSEKFSAVCSSCKKDTTVPFKPEPGRPVYCKDCISKIKSGEIKPMKGSVNQIRSDESKYFKPLADLGIEFEQKDISGQMKHINDNRYPEKNNRNEININQNKPGVFSKIKKVFGSGGTKKPKIMGDNKALRDVLNKTLNENVKSEQNIEEIKKEYKEVQQNKISEPAISLNELKISKPTPVAKVAPSRAAPIEEMNKLKDFISKKENEINKSVPQSEISEKQKEETKQNQSQPSVSSSGTVKEVPEDVLRKILE
jgi:CxxC-x17-CxxC domain-containing protein